jgi:transposase
MPEPLVLILPPKQRVQLERARDNHPKPYIRERCAALVMIAEGRSGRDVALNGLYKRRHPDTIYEWVDRYKTEGFQGLFIRPGRGRKPAFSP